MSEFLSAPSHYGYESSRSRRRAAGRRSLRKFVPSQPVSVGERDQRARSCAVLPLFPHGPPRLNLFAFNNTRQQPPKLDDRNAVARPQGTTADRWTGALMDSAGEGAVTREDDWKGYLRFFFFFGNDQSSCLGRPARGRELPPISADVA